MATQQPGKTLTIYNVPELLSKVQVTVCVPRIILSGLQSCGIYPNNRNMFSEIDLFPVEATNRDLSQTATMTLTYRMLMSQLQIGMIFKKQTVK